MSERRGPDAITTMVRVLAAVPIVLTLLPLWRTPRGWVRMWDFPRAQIAGVGLIAQACLQRWNHGAALDRTLAAGLAASLLYQAVKVVPYTRGYPRQVPGADPGASPRLRLLMANVLQDNRRADLVLQTVRDASADVVCLVETDAWWQRAMRPLEDDYPWVIAHPLDNTYGMILYSRLPLRSCDVRFLVHSEIPSMRAVVELPSGDEVVIHALHPQPPMPGTPTYGRDAELVMTAREIADDGRPAVVIGDLNDVAWSDTTALFRRVGHMVDPRIGRGMFNTFHAEHVLLRYPLDHVFHTRHFTLGELERLPYMGSDHFPILAELVLTPSRAGEMARPAPDEADQAVAEEILDDASEEEGPP